MKHAKYLLLLALCLALTACGSKPAASSGDSTSSGSGVSSSAPGSSQPEPESSAPDVPDEPEEPEEPDASQPEEHAPLTAEDKAAAYDAACDYYLGTVFDVQGLTEIGLRAGEITFQVSCTKGGAKVDPDRTISLARENGAWTVVSEGY